MSTEEQTPVEAQAELTQEEQVVEEASKEDDTRPTKGGPAAEKLLAILASHAPPSREFSVNDHEEYIAIYSPIVEEWLEYCLEEDLTLDEVDYAMGQFMSFAQFASDLAMTSLQETVSFAERKLLSKTLNLEDTVTRKKDLTMKQWDDIIKVHTAQ